MVASECTNSFQIDGVTVQMDGEDRAGLRSDGAAHCVGVHAVCVWINIHPYGASSGAMNRASCGNIDVRHGDHLAAPVQHDRFESHLDCGIARTDRDGMPATDKGREFLLQGSHLLV